MSSDMRGEFKTRPSAFLGWRFGAGLTPEQAELLDNYVDVMESQLPMIYHMLQQKINEQGIHRMILVLTGLVGRASGKVTDIDLELASEKNEDERLRILNHNAMVLRQTLVEAGSLAALMVVYLDTVLNPPTESKDVSNTDV